MMKTKACVIVAIILLLLPLVSSLVEPVKASGNVWWEYWHSGCYQNYAGYPHNISTTTTIYSESYDYWVKVTLVVSIYEYSTYFGYDAVNFRLLLYFDSFAQEGHWPPITPVPADFVTFVIDKDDSGSNLSDQCISVEISGTPAGFSQGAGLSQRTEDSSDFEDRAFWALDILGFAAGLFYEPVDIAAGLISIAQGYASLTDGQDYQDADWPDTRAYCWWHNPGLDFGSANPVRQYAFNSIRWLQNSTINPNAWYGLKIWARVGLTNPGWNPIGEYIDMAPVFLRIYHKNTGGGGCPALFVWNSSDYVDYGVIDIHNPTGEDVIREVPVQAEDVSINNYMARFRLREGWLGLNSSESVIDQVKLYAVDDLGSRHLCPLMRAMHSRLGNVLLLLLASDDYRVQTLLLETIDLRFIVPYQNIQSFVFVIEGCNILKEY